MRVDWVVVRNLSLEQNLSRDQKELQTGRSACAIFFLWRQHSACPIPMVARDMLNGASSECVPACLAQEAQGRSKPGWCQGPKPSACVWAWAWAWEGGTQNDTKQHRMPETSRMNDSGSTPSHHRQSLVSRGKQTGGTGEMKARPEQWAADRAVPEPKWLSEL